MRRDETYTEEEPLVLPARLEEIHHYLPWWTVLVSPIASFVGLLPSHKNSRRGRKAARRFKLIVGILGLAAIVFGASNWWAVGGGVVLLSMTPLPLPEVRKRSLKNRLERLSGEQRRRITRPARIIFDGRQLTLDKEGSTLRYCDVGGDDHGMHVGRIEGRYYLKMVPASGDSDETIWIATEEEPEGELPDSVTLSQLDAESVERQCLLDAEDWLKLVELMAGTLADDA